MNIAFVGTKGLPYQSTRDRNEYNLEMIAVPLAKRGHSIYVISETDYTQASEYKGIHIIATKPTIRATVNALKKIHNLEIVHIRSLEYAWVAFWISLQMPQVRIVFDYQQYTFINTTKNRQKFRLLTYISARFSDSLVIANPALKSLFIPAFKSKLYTIPTGVEINNEFPNTDLKSIYPQDYILVNVSQYRDSKSLDLFIKAYFNHSIDKTLVILGKVLPEIKKIYKSESIIFVGELSGDTEKSLIKNASIFVEISKNNEDKYPLSLALVSGVPVLASRAIYNQSLVKNKGIFFNSYNYSSIITALNTIQDMQVILNKMAISYIAIIKDKLSVDGQIHKYLYAYLNTFQNKHSRKLVPATTYSIPVTQ
jgi:glycosyltransferase involved in cell wall biosynthesis